MASLLQFLAKSRMQDDSQALHLNVPLSLHATVLNIAPGWIKAGSYEGNGQKPKSIGVSSYISQMLVLEDQLILH